jgi:Tfp pilus assembly protein PilX
MPFNPKKESRGMKKGKESGFALIAALLSVWILTAVGILVFTVTTQDVRISSRMVGEKKAFLATEAGVHQLTAGFDPLNLNDTNKYNSSFPVDPGMDPETFYRIGTPAVPTQGPASISMPGHSQSWGSTRFVSTVTGTNNKYQSSVQVAVGVGFGPVDITTTYR